jgi:NAD(P)-dependent dehydrogenase (short-subunit alcohol dehydrogenase family)
MKKLEGKWALVTGSSRGVGQHVAVGLAKHGCNVVVHGRAAAQCEKTLSLVAEHGVECFAAPGELGTLKGEEAVIDAVNGGCAQIDILYNNAGILNQWEDSIFGIPMDDWLGVFEVNFFAMVRLCNAFVPGMVERGWGRVVNVTSGIKDQPQLSPYSVSKASVDKYTQDMAAELKDTGVIINTMDPGWLKTDLGGEHADHEVSTVLPGAIVPVLLDGKADSGRMYSAQDYRCLGN